MKFVEGTDLGYLDESVDDIERGYTDAMTPDGRTRDNNVGLRSAYEEGLDHDAVNDQRIFSEIPARDDGADAVGFVDRPGQNYRTLIRRN